MTEMQKNYEVETYERWKSYAECCPVRTESGYCRLTCEICRYITCLFSHWREFYD